MKDSKQLKLYTCSRCGVKDFIFTSKGPTHAIKQLKTSARAVLISEVEIGTYSEEKVYREKNGVVTEPVFSYTSSRKTQSVNSVHYYTSRGWSEEEGNVFLSKHRKSHIGKNSFKYDTI